MKRKLTPTQQKIIDRLWSGDLCWARRTMWNDRLKTFLGLQSPYWYRGVNRLKERAVNDSSLDVLVRLKLIRKRDIKRKTEWGPVGWLTYQLTAAGMKAVTK